jgi:hypothetical protein
VLAFRLDDGYVIALFYGAGSDWHRTCSPPAPARWTDRHERAGNLGHAGDRLLHFYVCLSSP